ncbi:hypothetical protein OS242_15450 [Tumebacillus sp. DT12]|uniref:WAP domain-containing protein n=1 Tax=Tumebacillus lacus TaxID=2995335 RepID=A0ABT3X363_9BACL|nr:hypothetical protein [Tumebacillus lacus]MCX7571344.1 hypothetical protein [Tumebacillus lacus]
MNLLMKMLGVSAKEQAEPEVIWECYPGNVCEYELMLCRDRECMSYGECC